MSPTGEWKEEENVINLFFKHDFMENNVQSLILRKEMNFSLRLRFLCCGLLLNLLFYVQLCASKNAK